MKWKRQNDSIQYSTRLANSRMIGKSEKWRLVPKWTVSPLIRWDEKAGLRGMRYAPNVSTCSRHNKKETGDEED
jgi:hypothetical protein